MRWCSPCSTMARKPLLNSRARRSVFQLAAGSPIGSRRSSRAARAGGRKTDVSVALATRDYDELSGMFNKTGRFNPEALKVLSRSFVEMGMLPNEPDVTKLVTEQYLPASK